VKVKICPAGLNARRRKMENNKRIAELTDRAGWLCVGVKDADLFTENEVGWRELTELGQEVDECLEEFGAVAVTLGYFIYSKQESAGGYDVYATPFERDLSFVADGLAAFGWGVCFIPDIHIEQLNGLLRERGIHNVTFWWSRTNIL